MSFVIGTTFEINGYIGWNKATRDRSIKLSVHDLSTTHTYLSTYEFQCGSSRSTLNLRPDVELVPLNYRIYDFLHAEENGIDEEISSSNSAKLKIPQIPFSKKKKKTIQIESNPSDPFPFDQSPGEFFLEPEGKVGRKFSFLANRKFLCLRNERRTLSLISRL